MMVVIIILGVISSIAYPMLFMNQKITTQQIKESAKRNDIRSLESFLKDDLRNCKNVVESGPPETYEYKINLNSTEEILYKRLQDDQGRYYISRQRGTEVIDFKDIVDIDLEKEQGNNNLYNAQITSTDDKGNPYLHELKIARWEWEVKKKNKLPIFIEDKVFIMGTNLYFKGDDIVGDGATVIISSELKNNDLPSNGSIHVSNIFFGGDVKLNNGSNELGFSSNPGEIHVNGSLDLWSGTRNIYGDIFVNGDFDLKDAKIHGNVYVSGDLKLGWTPFLSEDTKIYYTGEIKYPSHFDQSILDKCIKQAQVPSVKKAPYSMPSLKDDFWYDLNGYVAGNPNLSDNIKIYSESYNSNIYLPTTNNVIIVAKTGDISIKGLGGSGLSGILFAPNGKITFEGAFFEGLAISKDGFDVVSGGTRVEIKELFPFDEYPFYTE
jgi:type II secretory pathway pseudopilin PulG